MARFGELWTLFMGESMSDKATLLVTHPPLSEESQPGRLDHRGRGSSTHAHAQIHSDRENTCSQPESEPKEEEEAHSCSKADL